MTLPEHWHVLPLKTETLPPATHTNAALVGDDHFVVIDPGASKKAEQRRLAAEVERRLDRGAQLVAICLTHEHPDHTRGVGALLSKLGQWGVAAPIMAHVHTLDTAALPPDAVCIALTDETDIDLGEHRLKALLTAGHARGHLAFWDQSAAVCYGGDMVASEGTIVVNPPEGDMVDYLDSLHRLAGLSLSRLVPSHGDVIDDPAATLDYYVAHRLERESLVEKALTDDPKAPLALVPAAYPELSILYYPLAARSLLAHLLKLEVEERAVRVGDKWKRP